MHDHRTIMAKRWFRNYSPNPAAKVRLFCFPYAGGGATIYRNWSRLLPDWIDVCPVQLPGREDRLGERAFTEIRHLCDALVPVLEPHLDIPVALFGHSMGAIVAFELALRLGGRPSVDLAHLLVSGQRAPHIPLFRPRSYDLPDREFMNRLRTLAGTPEAVLHNEELMDLLRPLLRADFELSERAWRDERPRLGCPVTAFGGQDDAEVHPDKVKAWSQATTGPFRAHHLPGDHFFIHEAETALTLLVAESLATTLRSS